MAILGLNRRCGLHEAESPAEANGGGWGHRGKRLARALFNFTAPGRTRSTIDLGQDHL